MMHSLKKRKTVDGFIYGLMIFASVAVGSALIGIVAYILIQSAGMVKLSVGVTLSP